MANTPKTGEQAPAAPGDAPSTTAPLADPSPSSAEPGPDDRAASEPGAAQAFEAEVTAEVSLEDMASAVPSGGGAPEASTDAAAPEPEPEPEPDSADDDEVDELAKTQIFTPRTLPGFGAKRTPTADAPAPPPPPITFDELELPEALRQAVAAMKWDVPTPVQQMTFPLVTRGRDVLVQSQTGSGKTAAFCLPWLAQRFEAGDPAQTGVQLLVLTPTRELAKQVCDQLEQLGRESGVRTLPIYGGTAMQPQLQALREGVHAVVGTPGRILDHIRRRSLRLDRVRMAVLDEADEMLSMGFLEDIHAILDACPTERQTCLFSATVPPDIERIARRYMHDPESVLLSGDQVAAAEIKHAYYTVSGALKVRDLLDLVAIEEPPNALIFCNTREETYVVASALHREGYHAEPLSSDLAQSAREGVMGRMRSGQLRFLVATDVASRGIDISHIGHVINYSFPDQAESYVHRTGRTGRAGRPGEAISLIAPQELGNFYYLKLQYPSITFQERTLPPNEELSRQRLENKLDQVSRLFPELVAPEWVLLTRHLVTDPRGEQVIAFLLKEAMARVAAEREREPGDLELRRPRRPDADRGRGGRGRRDREDWGEPSEREAPRGRGRGDGDEGEPRRGRFRDAGDERSSRAREDGPASAEAGDERRSRARDRGAREATGAEAGEPRRSRVRGREDDRARSAEPGEERRGRPLEQAQDRSGSDEPRRSRGRSPRRDDGEHSRHPAEVAAPTRASDEGADGNGDEPRGRRRRRGRDRRDERDHGGEGRDGGAPRARARDAEAGEDLHDAGEQAPTLALSEEELSQALSLAYDEADEAQSQLEDDQAPEEAESEPRSEGEGRDELRARDDEGPGGRRRRRRRRGRRSREADEGERTEADAVDEGDDEAAPGETVGAGLVPPMAGEDLGSTIAADGADDDEAEGDFEDDRGQTVEAGAVTDEVTDPGTLTGVGGRRRRRRRRRGRGRPEEGGSESGGETTDEGDARESAAEGETTQARGDDEGEEGSEGRRRRRRRGGRRRARGEGNERAPERAQPAPAPVPAHLSQEQIVIDIDEEELDVVRDEFGEIDELDDLTLKGRRRGVMESLQEEVELEDLSDEDRDDELELEAEGEDHGAEGEASPPQGEALAEGEALEAGEDDDEAEDDEDPRDAKKRKRRRRRRAKKKAEPAAPPELTAPPHKDFWEVWAAKFTYKDFEDDTYLGGTAAVPDEEPEPEPQPVRTRGRERDRDRGDRDRDRGDRDRDRGDRDRGDRDRERRSSAPAVEPPQMPAVEDEETFVRVRLNVGRKHGKKAAHIRELLADHFGLARKAVRDLTVGEASTRFRLGALALAELDKHITGFELDGIPLTVTRVETRPDGSEEDEDTRPVASEASAQAPATGEDQAAAAEPAAAEPAAAEPDEQAPPLTAEAAEPEQSAST